MDGVYRAIVFCLADVVALRGGMSNTLKEINQMVQDAARRQKELDKHKADFEKTEFMNVAIEGRQKLEHQLHAEKKDHSKVFMAILGFMSALLIGVITFQFIQLYRDSGREIWVRPVIASSDLSKAKEFLSGLLAKPNISLDAYLKPEIPSPWKKNTNAIFKEIRGRQCQVLAVTKDEKQLGENALIRAECSSPEPNMKVVFHLFMVKNDFLILKAEKFQIASASNGGGQ